MLGWLASKSMFIFSLSVFKTMEERIGHGIRAQRREDLFWLTDQECHGKKVKMWQAWKSWSHCIHSQEAESKGYRCLAHGLLFLQSRVQARGVVLPTFRVGLPTPISPNEEQPSQTSPEASLIYIIPHRCVWRLDPVKLVVSTNPHLGMCELYSVSPVCVFSPQGLSGTMCKDTLLSQSPLW